MKIGYFCCLPCFEDCQGVGWKTIDGQVRPAFVVANGDREPAEVGPDHVQNGLAAVVVPHRAIDVQGLAFAGIGSLVQCCLSVSRSHCKENKETNFIDTFE